MDYRAFFESDDYNLSAPGKNASGGEKSVISSKPANCHDGCMPKPSVPMPTEKKPDCGNIPLAIAYVPFQQWREIYDAETSLRRGTIFRELDKPFRLGEVKTNGR